MPVVTVYNYVLHTSESTQTQLQISSNGTNAQTITRLAKLHALPSRTGTQALVQQVQALTY